jgi:hypothetical protein
MLLWTLGLAGWGGAGGARATVAREWLIAGGGASLAGAANLGGGELLCAPFSAVLLARWLERAARR